MTKNCKGITLTALVTTVIILGIITAITIYATTGNNIAGEATKATKDFNDASVKQILDNIYLSEKNKYNGGLITEEMMIDNIKNAIEDHEKLQNKGVTYSETDTELIIKVGDNNYTYKIKDEKIIQFTIDGIKYQAKEGMTWKEWVDSSYNANSRFYIPDGAVWDSGTGGKLLRIISLGTEEFHRSCYRRCSIGKLYFGL